MKEITFGTINVPENIDITDPSYNKDVWCRINNMPIPQGEYEAYALFADNAETNGWGERIARCGLRKHSQPSDHTELKGFVGVDSGLCGFSFTDNCRVFDDVILPFSMIAATVHDTFFGKDYFFTSSGYGDGNYPVEAGYSGDELVDLFITFIE